MEHPICPACKAENNEKARYCDQCGQPLALESEPGGDGGGCPACGGEVEDRGGGKGACARCGLELSAEEGTRAATDVDAGVVARLRAALMLKLRSGLPADQAVDESCAEVFDAPASAEAVEPAPEASARPCPLCGAENPGVAAQCAGCAIWLSRPGRTAACPRCERPAGRGDKCECGAILSLPKLLESLEPSVRFVCRRCKQPYAKFQPQCPDCGGGLIGAERLKTYAETRGILN